MKPLTKLFGKYPVVSVMLAWVLLLSVFYEKVLFEGHVFFLIDASRFFFPLWKWGAGVLQQGIIPLWNPDAQFGTPYFADPQMACAYPPVFFFYSWFSPINAFSALLIFHHFWAVLGFCVWAKCQGFSAKAILWGSLAFGFSLHLVCADWTPVALLTISWLPWVLAAAERVYLRQSNGFLFLSLCWAMQLSAGYPVLTYLTGLALLVHFSWRSFQSKQTSFVWVGWIGLSALIATFYNLVWGLPFADFLAHSNYQNGPSRVQDLDWIHLATFLNPFISGHPLAGDYQGPDYWIATYFVGLPTLCLLIWGLSRKVYQKNSPWLLALFLVLSLGSTLKLGSWLKFILPGYALVIHSGFWISLAVLWVIVLAMEALESFIEDRKFEKIPWLVTALFIYGLALVLKKPYFSAFFWVSLILLLSALMVKSQIARWLLLLSALVFSLGPAAFSLNRSMDRSFYEKPPEALSQLHHSGRLFFSPVLLAQALQLQGHDLDDAYHGAKETVYPNWPLAYGREEVPIYNTLQLSNSFAWTFQIFQNSLAQSRKALNFLGIRYIFGNSHFDDLVAVKDSGEGVKIFENTKNFPLWFSVIQAIPAQVKVQDDFIRTGQADFRYENVCFIQNAGLAGSYQKRQVEELQRTANQVSLSAPGKGKALVISSETDAPGWKVRVDGESREVQQTDHAFRGVVLQDGESKIEFKYEPLCFRVGLFFTLLVCALWLGLGVKKFL